MTRVDRDRLTRTEWGEWGSRGTWRIPSVRKNDSHEAMFPQELPRRCIRLLTDPGDVVLDCFAGAGTTALAVQELDRRYIIGIELDRSYVRVSPQRLGHPAV